MSAAPAGEPLERAADWRRTSPAGILAQGLRSLIQAFLPTVALFLGTDMRDTGLVIIVLVALAIVAVSFLVATLAWWKLRYRIGENDIRVHRGLIARTARSVPFERIQDVSLEQGFVPRLLGLVEVRFETGAGGKDEVKLAFVTRSEGEALRETVRAPSDRTGQALDLVPDGAVADGAVADGARVIRAEPVVLFTMTIRRLLLFGLFEFSLVIFAVLAGAAQQFDFLLPHELRDLDYWEQQVVGPAGIIGGARGAWLVGIGWATRIIGMLVAVLMVGLVGLITGLVRTVARDYRFRLERTAKGFRRRRGLITRSDVVMPRHRVQALRITTGLVRRIWGWQALSFISLADDAGSANHQVAPFAREDEITPIVCEAGFALPTPAALWHRPSRHFRTDRAILSAMVPLILVLAAIIADRLLLALPALGLAAVLGGRQVFLHRYEQHALEAGQLAVRTGWLRPQLVIASRVKLHSVEIVQGPLARIRGYAGLHLGLAGGTLHLEGLKLSEARGLRTEILASITEVDFSRLPE